MDINKMKESKYLTKGDFEAPTLVTIEGLRKTNVARENETEELKWLMKLKEFQKPMVLNWTNIQLTAHALQEQDTDNWIGKRITVFNDPTVSYKGIHGAIRVKPESPDGIVDKPAPAKQPTLDDYDEDITW